MGALNVAAAIATVASLFVALWQYLVARHAKLTERERVIMQRERLRTAVAEAMQGAETADMIVQRAKEQDVTIEELQNIARIIRGNLTLLTKQLMYERSLLAGWRVGHLMKSDPPPDALPVEATEAQKVKPKKAK